METPRGPPIWRPVINGKFQMRCFRNERHHGIGNFKNYLFLGHLQPPLDKNSEDLVILILEFDDVTVKSIYCFLSSLEWGPEGGLVWGSTFCTVLAQDVLKSPVNCYSTHEPSFNYRKHN